MPERIQRSRAKGWRMPAGAVYVGRGTHWGNPFIAGQPSGVFHDPPETLIPALSLDQAIEFYRDLARGFLSPEMAPHGHEFMRRWNAWCHGMSVAQAARAYLRGKSLACWCPRDRACHADVLIELANR